MSRRWADVLALVAGLAATAAGQAPSRHVLQFPAYRLVEGALDSDGFPISGAKLCVVKPLPDCFQMPSNSGYSQGGVVYAYGLEPYAQLLRVGRNGSVVLFLATFSGGGSGSLTSLALLRYEAASGILNLLPFVGLSEQSDQATWEIPEISDYPILLTADYRWSKGETHFAGHYYNVTAYRMDAATDRYARMFRYGTSKKYASLDETDKVNVIEPERANIIRHLKASATSRQNGAAH